LAALRGVDRRACRRNASRKLIIRLFLKSRDRPEKLDPGTKRKTEFAEMLLRQIRQDSLVDRIVAECRFIAFET
jgi:hypothetical protein